MGLTDRLGRHLYRYSFDIVNNREAHGWCFRRLNPDRPVTLRFYADDTRLGECEVTGLREDVRDHGLHPSGRCGFRYRFPFPLDSNRFQRFSVRADHPGAELYTGEVKALPRVVDQVETRVLFMHIPKTAGTSFNAFARKYFDQARTIAHIEVNDPGEFEHYPGQYDYISGHLPIFRLRQHFDFDDFSLYTIIREPYAHLHSHFNWVRAIARDAESGFARRHPQVVQDLAASMKGLALDDPAVLGNFIDRLPAWGLDFFDNIQTRYFLDQRPEKVTPEHLDQALENTNAFTSIGLTERYEHFSRRFCEDIGAEYQAQKTALNRSRVKPLFDYRHQAIRSVLHPLIETDLRLYEHVNRGNGDD